MDMESTGTLIAFASLGITSATSHCVNGPMVLSAVFFGEIAALVHYGLLRFELLACHLTTDQASGGPHLRGWK